MKIGIIGFGVIGKAIAKGLVYTNDLYIWDKYVETPNTKEETIQKSEIIFVCVPTPMRGDGRQDISALDDVINEIDHLSNSEKVIVIRSTILPGTTRMYAEKYNNHIFVFMPEFLTERAAYLDFINPGRIILGINHNIIDLTRVNNTLMILFNDRFPHLKPYVVTWETAEVTKYMHNCFFAVKISYMNEMYDVAKELGIDYNILKQLLLSDGRVGNSHMDVPGHDGHRGYGGKCFPKDISAFIKWGEENGLDLKMIKAAQNVNSIVRKIEDWKNIKGATTHNNYN